MHNGRLFLFSELFCVSAKVLFIALFGQLHLLLPLAKALALLFTGLVDAMRTTDPGLVC